MKAERRRELKTNTLAQTLENFPLFWSMYGTKILIGVVAVLAIVLFVRSQITGARQTQLDALNAQAEARAGLQNLQALSSAGAAFRDPRGAAEQRRTLADAIEKAVEQVLQDTKSEALKAEALVTRGDLNWNLATAPDFMSTATQPATQPTAEEERLLDRAQQAYDAATRVAGAAPLTVTTARFGLAAIAEQRHRWNDARAAYDAIVNDPRSDLIFKAEAKGRLTALEVLQKPVLIGNPATNPFTTPATTQATTTTAPATTISSTTRPATTKSSK
jgi:hypothetical protein